MSRVDLKLAPVIPDFSSVAVFVAQDASATVRSLLSKLAQPLVLRARAGAPVEVPNLRVFFASVPALLLGVGAIRRTRSETRNKGAAQRPRNKAMVQARMQTSKRKSRRCARLDKRLRIQRQRRGNLCRRLTRVRRGVMSNWRRI